MRHELFNNNHSLNKNAKKRIKMGYKKWRSAATGVCGVVGAFVGNVCYASTASAASANIGNCFSDVDVVVRVSGSNDSSSGMVEKFIKHGLVTAESSDQHIDQTIFGLDHSNSVTIDCIGDECSTEDESIYNDLGNGCYGVMQGVINEVSKDVM